MASCPNKNLIEWKELEESKGTFLAHYIWNKSEGRKLTDQQMEEMILFQSDDMLASPSSEKTIEAIREASKQMGIKIQTLDDYLKGNPEVDTKGVNGLADLIKGVVAIAHGKEHISLTEEIVHIATAILEQTDSPLITELISKIGRFKIYNQVFETYKGKKAYQLADGKPDIRKIKKEAVDKLIVEVIINNSEGSTEFPELRLEKERSFVQRMWDTILDRIRGVYRKTNIDIFEQTGKQITEGKVKGTVGDIKTKGIFFQIDDHVVKLIDKFYNKYIDMDSRMELKKQIIIDNVETQKRHYLFDGVPTLRSVTQKVKAKFNKTFITTPAQQIEYDEKRDWGSDGHFFIYQYIVNNLIDKDGYRRKEFGTEAVSSRLRASLQIQLGTFAQELISSYPEGTRFLVERMVVNTAEKGMLGSTVDFKAIYPVVKKDGTQDIKVDTLDWKFTSIDKTKDDDIPWYKQDEFVSQMGEYTKIDYQVGIAHSQIGKARMIPFIVNYDNIIPGDRKSGIMPKTIEIGNLDSLKETNLYLLPVPTLAETSGNVKVDALVKSLKQHWEKLRKSSTLTEQDKYKKKEDLVQLSASIRNLQLKMEFKPLYNVAKSFLLSVKTATDSFAKIDYSTITEEELRINLKKLIDSHKSLEKFTSLDAVFLSQFPKAGMTPENFKILTDLEHISKNTEMMQNKITNLLRLHAVQLGVKEGIVSEKNKLAMLNPEAEVGGFFKAMIEGSKLGIKTISLVQNLLMKADSLVVQETAKQITEYNKLIDPLQKEASSAGKKAFNYIGKITSTGLELIQKIDKAFFKEMADAKDQKDKRFFLDNMDLVKYFNLVDPYIQENIDIINASPSTGNTMEDERIREFRINKLKDSVDIESNNFNGFNDFYFNKFFRATMIEEGHYSEEYKTMLKSKHALPVWDFFMKLNQKGRDINYLQGKGTSFFPLIEATTIEKFIQTDNTLGQMKESFWTDLYATRINEEQLLSKIDPETGEPTKTIPRFYTQTDKEVNQLSTDLNKVGALWIHSILEYEKSSNMQYTLQALLLVEKSKGSLMLENGLIVFDESGPMIKEGQSKNYDLLEVIVNDSLYKLGQDLSSLGNIGIATLSEKLAKTEEEKATSAINAKKFLHNADTLTRALAVGAKPLIAIANWSGNQFQNYINAGGLYNFWEDFEKNNLKVTSGRLSTMEKLLLNLVVPLNEDVVTLERRKGAAKQGIGKWLSTWGFTDVMMYSNAFPERKLQMANALSIIDNSMIFNGKIVNIRQHLKMQDIKLIYQKDASGKLIMSETDRKTHEKTFEERVKALRETSSLKKISKIENDEITIPGVSKQELANFRVFTIEYGRKLNGQMNENNKAGYRRDAIFSSFMMFKTWMPKLASERLLGLNKNVEVNQWEYGRVRLLVKLATKLGGRNIFKMRQILMGTDEGLAILDQILLEKRNDYFRKTGQILDISDEEFYEVVRRELHNEMKELQLLLLIGGMLFASAAAVPPEDATLAEKNKYKWYAKMINKISEEVTFYYNPLAFESMTKGSILPSLNLLTKIERIGIHIGREFGDKPENAHVLKQILGVTPGASQFMTEILPYLNPELSKELGYKVTEQSRAK